MKGRHTRDRFIFALPNQLAAWQETNELTAHLAEQEALTDTATEPDTDEVISGLEQRWEDIAVLHGVASALAARHMNSGIRGDVLGALDAFDTPDDVPELPPGNT